MKFNEEIATAYIKHYGHQLVNARSLNRMITTIFNGRYDTEVSLKRLVYLTCSDNTDLEFMQHYAKRYDLVDYDNKIIYEFDGEHHFKFTEFYHDDYAEFVNRRRADIDKQRILYRLGFDLVRVSGELTIVGLFNMLMRSNRQVGQSRFIRNSEMMIVSTGELAFELNDVDMLKRIVVDQQLQIKELQQQLDDILSNQDIHEDFNQLNLDKEHVVDSVSLFLDKYIDKLIFYGVVPTKVLYKAYQIWCNANDYDIEKYFTFSRITTSYCKLNDFKFSESRSTFSTYQLSESLCRLLNIENDKELFKQMQKSLVFKNQINHNDLLDFYKNVKKRDSSRSLTNKEIQMVMMLYYDLNKSDIRQTFDYLFN